ncbi:MAG: hypothetical protein JNL08_18835 [Planctomycetes bacterium]|nr:hypothetical protein [Planctomycetota bacterium]
MTSGQPAPPDPGRGNPAAPRRYGIADWLLAPLYVAVAALVWLLTVRPPSVPPRVELDASWNELVAFDFRHRLQAGVDFVFTYGPLGYFVSGYPTYTSDVFWTHWVLSLTLNAMVAVAVVLPVLRMHRTWQRLAYLLVVFATTPIADNAFALLAISGSTLFLLFGSGRPLATVPALVMFTALGFGKFTFFVLGFGCVGLLTLSSWHKQGLRKALAVPAVFALVVAVTWTALGQSPLGLPAFLKGSAEIASGYNQSMRWVTQDGRRPHVHELVFALVPIAILAIGALLACVRRPRSLVAPLAAGVVAATLFLGWKAGFVRQDAGHVMICYCCVAVAASWLWCLPRPARGGWLVDAMAAAASAIAFLGAFRLEGGLDYRPGTLPRLVTATAKAHWRFVTEPAGLQRDLETRRRRVAVANRLGAVRAAVGDATVDEVPHGQNILFLNDLTVHHRPVFQSYSAYSPYLQRLNGDFYEDPARAPSFVLLRIESTDGQYPTVADSQVYRALLRHYRPRLVEGGYLLLERQATAAPQPPVTGRPGQRQVFEREARLDEWVTLEPGEGLGELAVDLHYSTTGALWNAAFRGPRLYIDVRLANGSERGSWVTSRGLMQLPFVVDPLIVDLGAFTRLYTGGNDLQRVVAFRLRSRAGREHFYRPTYRCTFWRSDLPPPIDEATARAARLHFPMLSSGPRETRPRSNFVSHRERGRDVLIAQPPSEMLFDAAGRVSISGVFGIRPEAYAGEPATDGVTFRIEGLAADGTRSTLFERRLEPVREPADRGTQEFALAATLPPGSTVVLSTLPGPSGSMDWSYWGAVDLLDLDNPPPGRMLTSDVVSLPRAEGGDIVFRLDAGVEFAHRDYWVIGSDAGTWPGSTQLEVPVPLNASDHLAATLLANTNGGPGAVRGRLDEHGRARAVLPVPPGGLPGSRALLHHAFLVLGDGMEVLAVSNAVPLHLH